MAEIAVIVVNYNAGELALAAVESVLAHTHPGHDVHVHLVDNASPNGDGAMLAEAAETRGWGARVTLHLERVNHGFGRGNNLVLEELARRAAPPDYVFLLNPDAQLEGETLATLADFLAAHPKAAVAGARIRQPDSPKPVTAAFRFPSAVSTLSAAINFGPVARALARYEVALPADIPTQRVDWVAGAAVLARFDVWRELGFFDPEYFLYFEEVDLMLRTARAGWECWHVAEAQVVHVEGASTEVRSLVPERTRRPAYWYHSWQHYFRKNHGRGYALASAAAWTGGAAINHALVRVRGGRAMAPKRFFGDFWAVGCRPLLGLPPGRV